ncbi:hypothetical protein [Nonlabens agnitus]|uniref:Uncharacterized protein n=1 Tax=Nonlabens agnitus TaxID=870484 RepID=A0A2S9WXB1_9FLAO|nr:hypothetical protein [Nonlabens agnitus]PRP68103.1 hypothetical protein BST86_13910 [Nonlabens agnitus]
MKNEGMNNPLVVASAAEAGIEVVKDNFKPIVITGAVILGLIFLPKAYKNWRAGAYARANAGSPNVVAAGIIANSFTRFEFPGTLSWILPDINISTNETALNDIASRVTSFKDVSDAYYILFDRTLDKDIQEGLDTEEMQTFYDILRAKQYNEDTQTYAIGSELYCAAKNGIQVFQAVKIGNGWTGTGELYDNFKFRDYVGKVVAYGIVPKGDANGNDGKTYYIVEDCFAFGLGCSFGVVLQSQISNKKL